MLALLAGLSSGEAQERRRFGPWEVSIERNRFDDGNNIVIATQAGRGVVLGVRCLADRSFSLAIVEAGIGTGRLQQGMAVRSMVRIDNNPVERPNAIVVNDRLIQINLPIAKAEQMLRGREIAVRLEVGVGTSDHVFGLTQAQRALSPVFEACREAVEPTRAEPQGFFDFDRETGRQRAQSALQNAGARISIPPLECRPTQADTRSCVSKPSPSLEFGAWEKLPAAANLDEFKRGSGRGDLDTMLVTLNTDEGRTQAERAAFFGLCAATLMAASPSLSHQAAQRRIEAAFNSATEQKRNSTLGVGSSTSPTDTLEMELSRGEATCLVYAKGR
jgi:hypothetical protein